MVDSLGCVEEGSEYLAIASLVSYNCKNCPQGNLRPVDDEGRRNPIHCPTHDSSIVLHHLTCYKLEGIFEQNNKNLPIPNVNHVLMRIKAVTRYLLGQKTIAYQVLVILDPKNM